MKILLRRKPDSELFHPLEKLCTIFLCFSLILSQDLVYGATLAAVITPATGEFHKREIDKIFVPEETGEIEEFHPGRLKKTVIYIQDAHDSLEAQQNIVRMIDAAVSQYGTKTVFEEGTQGPVATEDYFKSIFDQNDRRKISYYLLDQLRLGAAEYAHINRKQFFRLVGADNLKLHRASIGAYRFVSSQTRKITRDLDRMDKEINRLIQSRFPKAVKIWIQNRRLYDEDKLPMLDYLKRARDLFPSAGKENFQINYPNLGLLLSAESVSNRELPEGINDLDPKAVFGEILRMEGDLAKAYLVSEGEARIFGYFQDLRLLRRLARFQASPKEYAAVKAILQAFDTETFADFIVKETHRSLVLSKGWERYLRAVMRFYDLANARDQAIASALGDFARSGPDEKMAVLVFGGFHRENIQSLLRSMGFSYYILSPRINEKSPRQEMYYKKLMRAGYGRLHHAPSISRATTPPRDLTILNLFPERAGAYEGELRLLINIVGELERQGLEATPEEIELRVRSRDRVHSKKLAVAQAVSPLSTRSEARNAEPEPQAEATVFEMPVNFGLNIKRKTKEPLEIIARNVWNDELPYIKHSKNVIAKFGAAEREAMGEHIRIIIDECPRLNSPMAKAKVNLAENMAELIRIENGEITIDVSVLKLAAPLFRELVRYGADHIRYTQQVSHADPIVRELTAYFEQARDYLPVDEKAKRRLAVLRQAMKQLVTIGWLAKPHDQYLSKIQRALKNQALARSVQTQAVRLAAEKARASSPAPGAASLKKWAARNVYENAMSIRRLMRHEMSIQQRRHFIAENILKMGGAVEFDSHTARVLHKRLFLEPTVGEVNALVSFSDYSIEEARQLLRANQQALQVTRCQGVEILRLHAAYLGQNEFLKRIKPGRSPKSPVPWLVLDMIDRPAQMALAPTEPGLMAFSLFSKLVGDSYMRSLLTRSRGETMPLSLTPEIQDMFFRELQCVWNSLDDELFNKRMQQFMILVETGQIKDGFQYLKTGGDSRFILDFLDRIRQVDQTLEAFINRNRDLSQKGFVTAHWLRQQIFHRIITDWGLAVGPLLMPVDLRNVPSDDETFVRVDRLLSGYPEQFRTLTQAAASPGAQTLGRPLLAVLLISARMRTNFEAGYLDALTTWVETQIPRLVQADPYDSQDQFAELRAAFRYLINVSTPESQRTLAFALARHIKDDTGGILPPGAFPYGEMVLEMGAPDTETLFTVARAMENEILGMKKIPERQLRVAGFTRALNEQTAERRKAIAGKLIPNARAMRTLIDSGNLELKTYLWTQLDGSYVAGLLDELDIPVDQMRDKLRGVNPELRRSITKSLKYARPVRQRELYESFIVAIPEELEDYELGGTLPNHYRYLGIPRRADSKTIEASYRKLSVLYHEDLFMHEPPAERERAKELLRKINEAFEVLSDTEKRAEFDKHTANIATYYPQHSWTTLIRSETRDDFVPLLSPWDDRTDRRLGAPSRAEARMPDDSMPVGTPSNIVLPDIIQHALDLILVTPSDSQRASILELLDLGYTVEALALAIGQTVRDLMTLQQMLEGARVFKMQEAVRLREQSQAAASASKKETTVAVPLPKQIAGLSQPVTAHKVQLPVTAETAAQRVLAQTGIDVSDKDRRYMNRLIVSGRRSEKEVALAIMEAADRNMSPRSLLTIAQKHHLLVPVAVQVVDIAEEQGSKPHYIIQWMKQAHALIRGKRFQDQIKTQPTVAESSGEAQQAVVQSSAMEDATVEDFWIRASKEERLSAMQVAWDLRRFVKEKKDEPGATQFMTVRKLFKLYQAIGESGSIEGVRECVETILELPAQEWEFGEEKRWEHFYDGYGEYGNEEFFDVSFYSANEGWIYSKRYKELLQAIQEAGGLFFDARSYLASGRYPMDDDEREGQESELEGETDTVSRQLASGNTYHYTGKELFYREETYVDDADVSRSLGINPRPELPDSNENPADQRNLSDLSKPLNFEVLHKLLKKIPAKLFVPHEELKDKKNPIWTALASLADGGKNITIVIYQIHDGISDEYQRLHSFGFKVLYTELGLEPAYEEYHDDKEHDIHISMRAEYLKELIQHIHSDKMKHFFMAEASEIWAAYIRAITDDMQKVMGLEISEDGYYHVTGAFLRSECRRYQASFVVKTSA